jgi:MFS family permease
MGGPSMQSSLPNRWVLAITAFIMQLALGSVYAWSVFLNPVIALYHVSRLQANLTFSIVPLALGITAGFGGYLNNRFGPRVIATLGGILYGLGVILATFAAPNIFLLYLTLASLAESVLAWAISLHSLCSSSGSPTCAGLLLDSPLLALARALSSPRRSRRH